MMRFFKLIVCFGLLFSNFCNGQRLSIGLYNGVNYSDINGKLDIGKWETENGPISGLFINYALTKSISLQSEVDYTTIYYHYIPDPYILKRVIYPNRIKSKAYNNERVSLEFSYYRFPISIKFSTPTRLKFDLSAGIYFSILDKFNYTGNYAEEEVMPPGRDFGYHFSTGISYPLNNKLSISLNARYFSGRRVLFNYINAKNGATEIVFGLSYSGLFNKKLKPFKTDIPFDSIQSERMVITYKSGVLLSSNIGKNKFNGYSSKAGFTGGVGIQLNLSNHIALKSGVSFEQKGYCYSDSSMNAYRYYPNYSQYSSVFVDSKVDLSYVVIPLLLNLQFGNKFKFYLNGGLYCGLLVSSRVTGNELVRYSDSNNSYVYKKTVYDNIDANLTSDDWGWVGGAGVAIPIYKNYGLDIGFQYSQGLTNILENHLQAKNSDNSIKNKAIGFTVGFQVPIK